MTNKLEKYNNTTNLIPAVGMRVIFSDSAFNDPWFNNEFLKTIPPNTNLKDLFEITEAFSLHETDEHPEGTSLKLINTKGEKVTIALTNSQFQKYFNLQTLH